MTSKLVASSWSTATRSIRTAGALRSKPTLPSPHLTRPPRYISTTPTSTRPTRPSASLLRPQLILKRTYHFRPSQYDPDGSKLRDAQPLLTKNTLSRVARSPRTHTIAAIAMAAAVIFYFSNLETVPISGRTRFNVYSPESIRGMGEMQEKMLLYEFERNNLRLLSEWDPRSVRVKRVMKKLIPFSGMTEENWEIYVVDDPRTANAFVLPGGKVFVFSGILPLARNDSALAAVLGHEIAHNVAGHVGEKMSSGIGKNILLYSAMIAAGAIGFGPLLMHYVGSWFLGIAFEMPMSRKQESEADFIGLMIMAEACYDPTEAVGFWERMERSKVGEEVPEWESTHPSNKNRIKQIQEWMPKALDKRSQSDCHSTTAFADLFKRALEKGVLMEV